MNPCEHVDDNGRCGRESIWHTDYFNGTWYCDQHEPTWAEDRVLVPTEEECDE